MMDYPSMELRKAARAYASFKAGIYNESEAVLFIESSPALAVQIAALSKKPVLCMENRKMAYPDIRNSLNMPQPVPVDTRKGSLLDRIILFIAQVALGIQERIKALLPQA